MHPKKSFEGFLIKTANLNATVNIKLYGVNEKGREKDLIL